jgi:hypothetical protein
MGKEPEMRKEADARTTRLDNTGNLVEAAKAVYRRYGTDLTSFFREAYEAEAQARKREHQKIDIQQHDVEACP